MTRLAVTLLLGGAMVGCPIEQPANDAPGRGEQSPGREPGNAIAAGDDTARAQQAQQAQPPRAEGRLRIEVHQSARGRIYLDGRPIRTFPVAVGQPEYPTPAGDFAIHQVDWNPDWTPPDEDWASDATYQPPGAPDNPMGRVRMTYQAPFSMHGTDDIESLGGAESHGSIRVANETITEIARLVMEHGGQARDERWYRGVLGKPTEIVRVELSDPVPLRIYP